MAKKDQGGLRRRARKVITKNIPEAKKNDARFAGVAVMAMVAGWLQQHGHSDAAKALQQELWGNVTKD